MSICNSNRMTLILAALLSAMPTTQPAAETGFEENFSKMDLGYYDGGNHTWFVWRSLGIKPLPDLISMNDGVLTLTTSNDGRYGVVTALATFPEFEGDGIAKVGPLTYGYFEARMRFDPNEDNWPGFWLTSRVQRLHKSDKVSNGIADVACEIDIMEGVRKADTYGGTVHDHKWGYIFSHNITNSNSHIRVPEGTNFREWNNFAANWTPDSISWYFNGKLMSSWPTPQVCKTAQLFIVVQAAKFEGTRRQTVDVQWIRVSDHKPDAGELPK